MTPRVFAGVDLGASGGRVVAGLVDRGGLRLEVMARFPNGAVEVDGHLRWNLTEIYRHVEAGLYKLASIYPQVESIGIDTWGVDYGLLDAGGQLLGQPIAYRDERAVAAIDAVHALCPPNRLFAINGLQSLPINTIYQLAAERLGPRWPDAAQVVLLPDLLAYWITGEVASEFTVASTTGLLDIRTRDWSGELLGLLDIAPSMLPPIEQPGSIRGTTASLTGRPIPVIAVASHDTASAVVGIPSGREPLAYISSGTWSLVGVEREDPVLTDRARDAHFTNEGGVDGRTRFQRNLGGFWFLHECLRSWGIDDGHALLGAAGALPAGGPSFDVGDPGLFPPGRMPERINEAVAAAGGQPLTTPAAIVRSIIDSLADAYARTAHEASQLSDSPIEVIHIVGGGSQNELLCQLTADRAKLPVLAGPVEATALGNVLVQARAREALPHSKGAQLSLVERSTLPRRYDPS